VGAAIELCDELAAHDIFAHMSETTAPPHVARVYIKDSESICNLLALAGLKNCLYRLNDEIALRSVINSSNRRTNCDSANIQKQIEAATAQVEKIARLDLGALPPPLRETAAARMENPEATYDELAQILGITKSGVVHRLKRVLELCR